jgi:hypothetical protein
MRPNRLLKQSMQLVEVGLIQSVSSPRTDRIQWVGDTTEFVIGSIAKLYLAANHVFARL